MVPKPQFEYQGSPSELYLIDAISGKWTVLAVRVLSSKTMRYGELHRAIGTVSQKVLTQTLRNLERNGIVSREVYPVVPPQVEYSLTPLGRTLVDVLNAVCMWAIEHHVEAEKAREQYDRQQPAKE